MKTVSLFAQYLASLNTRRRVTSSQERGRPSIIALFIGGIIFAALLYAFALATMSVGELAAPVTSHQSPITSARP
jgi:hypothetical protein